ncbi:glycosyltransferase [Candidatus Peregrinibacteria bacterium]|nr:glycosyltransferase [Candidatus Peregrinibacteria bacterium]
MTEFEYPNKFNKTNIKRFASVLFGMQNLGHPNQFTRVNFKHPKKKDFISVVIPVYKDPEGIRDTLESLKKQTLDRSRYEVIVAIDGGDEKTGDVCRGFDVKMVNITPTNKGPANARNMGMEESSGEYIAFIDADMNATETWLETGFNALKYIADYIGGPMKIDNNNIKTLEHLYDVETAFDVNAFFSRRHFVPTGNLFVKRKLIEEIGGIDVRLIHGEDHEFGSRIYNNTNFVQLFLNLDSITAIHPPRSLKELVRKQEVYAKGLALLPYIYPKRYKKDRIIPTLLRLITPPLKPYVRFPRYKLKSTYEKFKIFQFLWLSISRYHYYKLKYIIYVKQAIKSLKK